MLVLEKQDLNRGWTVAAALLEMLKIALLKIHTSMRSESSKLKLGRIRQQKSVKLCIPSIDMSTSDLRNIKDF